MSRRFGGRVEGNFRQSASKAGRSADHTTPLRAIVTSFENDHGRPMLRLECGHEVSYPSGGWTSEYTPGSRRCCRYCAADIDQQQSAVNAEPGWEAYSDLSPLEARHADGDR
jgi:hypothetical protein